MQILNQHEKLLSLKISLFKLFGGISDHQFSADELLPRIFVCKTWFADVRHRVLAWGHITRKKYFIPSVSTLASILFRDSSIVKKFKIQIMEWNSIMLYNGYIYTIKKVLDLQQKKSGKRSLIWEMFRTKKERAFYSEVVWIFNLDLNKGLNFKSL